MDQNQDNQVIEDLPENIGPINEGILNTPAEQPKRVDELLPDISPDTFFKFNQPRRVQPQEGIILDVGGKQTQIGTSTEDLKADTKILQKIFGDEVDIGEAFDTNTILLILSFIVVVFFFVMFSLKRSEQIGHLEKELEKLKRRTI